jgi:hypothetical protein
LTNTKRLGRYHNLSTTNNNNDVMMTLVLDLILMS